MVSTDGGRRRVLQCCSAAVLLLLLLRTVCVYNGLAESSMYNSNALSYFSHPK